MPLYTLFLLVPTAAADDLTVDNTTITMDGAHEYDNVYVINGGTLAVTDYDGSGTTGTLTLTATYIYVDSTSRIDASGAGYHGVLNANGAGPGGGEGGSLFRDSGGGGGYGADGGHGVGDDNRTTDGLGGRAYGSATDVDIDMGSAGGAAGASDGDSGGHGADGGGAVWLQADQIVMAGIIDAHGFTAAVVNGDAPGGGSGGGVLLFAAELDCTGAIDAYGGDGADTDDNGGGAGGGRIKQFYDTVENLCSVDIDGGAGPGRATGGGSGSHFDSIVDYDGDGYTSKKGDCDPTDPTVYPGAVELPDGIDNDCDGYIEETDTGDPGDTDVIDPGDTDIIDTDIFDTGDTDIIDTDIIDTDPSDTGDTDVIDTDPNDTGNPGPAFTYEGGGGCGCDAKSANSLPAGLLAGLVVALLALARRRRRA